MSRPGKTTGGTPSVEIGFIDPDVKFVDASSSLEVSLAPGVEVPDKTSLGCVDDPVAIITGLDYCNQWSTHLSNLVKHHCFSSLIGLNPELLLPHIWEPPSASGDIMLSPL